MRSKRADRIGSKLGFCTASKFARLQSNAARNTRSRAPRWETNFGESGRGSGRGWEGNNTSGRWWYQVTVELFIVGACVAPSLAAPLPVVVCVV